MSSPRGSPAPVLHGGWVLAHGAEPARFAIWGEEPFGRPRPRSMRKRKPLPHRPAPHPFALSDDGIRHALSVLGLTPWLSQGSVRQLAASLPTVDREPRPGRAAEAYSLPA